MSWAEITIDCPNYQSGPDRFCHFRTCYVMVQSLIRSTDRVNYTTTPSGQVAWSGPDLPTSGPDRRHEKNLNQLVQNDFNHFLRVFEFLQYLYEEWKNRGRSRLKEKRLNVVGQAIVSMAWQISLSVILPFLCLSASLSFTRGSRLYSTLSHFSGCDQQSVSRGQPLHMLSISRSNTAETTSTRSLRNPQLYWLAIYGN